MIKTDSMLYFSAFDTVSRRKPFDEVFHRFTKFILVNKLLYQREKSISISHSMLGYLCIRALAVASATMVMATPLLLLIARRYVCTI